MNFPYFFFPTKISLFTNYPPRKNSLFPPKSLFFPQLYPELLEIVLFNLGLSLYCLRFDFSISADYPHPGHQTKGKTPIALFLSFCHCVSYTLYFHLAPLSFSSRPSGSLFNSPESISAQSSGKSALLDPCTKSGLVGAPLHQNRFQPADIRFPWRLLLLTSSRSPSLHNVIVIFPFCFWTFHQTSFTCPNQGELPVLEACNTPFLCPIFLLVSFYWWSSCA